MTQTQTMKKLSLVTDTKYLMDNRELLLMAVHNNKDKSPLNLPDQHQGKLTIIKIILVNSLFLF